LPGDDLGVSKAGDETFGRGVVFFEILGKFPVKLTETTYPFKAITHHQTL
jgi:hypothetical protein